MNQIVINLIAMVVATAVTFLNYIMAFKFRLLRRGMLFISSGLFLAVMIHSIVEFLESAGLISSHLLVKIMPILVATGSILTIAGGVIVSRDAIGPLNAILQDIHRFSSPELPFKITPGVTTLRNEIGNLARSFQRLVGDLKETTVSKIYFESIIRTTNDAFISIDEEGIIKEWNPAAERIFGWSRPEVMGKALTGTIIPVQYREAHEKGLRHFIRTGEGHVLGKTLEFPALRRDGREIAVDVTIWSLQENDKYQFNAFIRDITERKKAHEALAEREKALRQTFEELSSAHEQLKKTQNQLLQSEKLASIGQLAAGVAHEINNPAGFISNNMEVLEQYIRDYLKILQMTEGLEASIAAGDLKKAVSGIQDLKKLKKEINLDYITDDAVKLMQQNREGIDRIRGIITDLRTFARDDREDGTERIRVEDVVENVLRIVHSEIRYKADLQKNYADTPPVPCSPNRLGQVFLNLIVNALQAIEGRGTIEIKTYQQNGFVCVDVRDTGKGIDEQHLGRIFDPFFTTKAVGEGTGLGLSVSYEIVKKHGGDIKVKSKTGTGTTFTVMLPLRMNQSQREIGE